MCRLAPGHVGRLQVLRSGRVFLVLDEPVIVPGRDAAKPLRHQVNLGVGTNFVQVLVSVPPVACSDGSVESEGEGGQVDLFVLGSVTKKLVVTPVFA